MAKRETAAAHKKAVRVALELKREKDRRLRRCLIMAPVLVAAFIAPYLLFSVGVLDDIQVYAGISSVVMIVAAMVIGAFSYQYQKAKTRYRAYCQVHAKELSYQGE